MQIIDRKTPPPPNGLPYFAYCLGPTHASTPVCLCPPGSDARPFPPQYFAPPLLLRKLQFPKIIVCFYSWTLLFQVWNNDLARVALDWGQQCRWQHGQPDLDLYPNVTSRYPSGLGQNLFTTYSIPNRTVQHNIQVGLQGWYEETENYNLDTDSCVPGALCGHYTQVRETQT